MITEIIQEKILIELISIRNRGYKTGLNKGGYMQSSEFYESYFNKKLTHLDREKDKQIYFLLKRVIDILLSLLGLIIGGPLVLFFGALIYLESPGSIIFKQKRVGKNGKIFVIYKLRSMKLDAEKNGQKWADKNDDRVLKVGKFIRRTRIDEIPQLFNILKGEMTLIGPRPEIPKFTYEFEQQIPGFVERLSVTPGLTGLAQVKGGYDMTPAQKLEKDLEYISKKGFFLDCRIVLDTIIVILTGKGAR